MGVWSELKWTRAFVKAGNMVEGPLAVKCAIRPLPGLHSLLSPCVIVYCSHKTIIVKLLTVDAQWIVQNSLLKVAAVAMAATILVRTFLRLRLTAVAIATVIVIEDHMIVVMIVEEAVVAVEVEADGVDPLVTLGNVMIVIVTGTVAHGSVNAADQNHVHVQHHAVHHDAVTEAAAGAQAVTEQVTQNGKPPHARVLTAVLHFALSRPTPGINKEKHVRLRVNTRRKRRL